ncbi:MAG: anaerobic ribonucleoside-triphosphate reductase activating protein [Butyrivibrio sp.]|nr:anaerobic ribonucleoside-triphosphate reductase activating protein [Butyrivibrio sp.]
MLIAGLQKMSLVDYPGRVACTVFTGGCNLRCPYCHNSELLDNPPEIIDISEFMNFLDKRKGMLDAVCITGGEPCLQGDLPYFIEAIREKGFLVKLDTNGMFPNILKGIIEKELVDYVAVDYKSSPESYIDAVGVRNWNMKAWVESLEILLEGGMDFELRTTVVSPIHTKSTFIEMRDFLIPIISKYGRKIPNYYLQPFVDRETVVFQGLSTPLEDEIKEYSALLSEITDKIEIRGL